MQEAARESNQDYWRPAKASLHIAKAVLTEATCPHCGATFAIGAEFCHVCGTERQADSKRNGNDLAHWLASLQARTGFGPATLAMAVVAAVCLIAALMVSSFYRADNYLTWQAVQQWRMEWLMGSIISLLGAILLKK